MSTGDAALVIAAVAGTAFVVLAAIGIKRLRRLETAVTDLTRSLHEVEPALGELRTEVRSAAHDARRAARAACAPEPPPPALAFEPVTGPVVKAVAFGAGARRVLQRLGPRPRARARRARNGDGA